MRLKNVIHASTYIRGYPMLTLYIADAERDAGMKNLSRKEAAKILEGMKVKIKIPKAAVTQWERNAALDMAIEVLNCSEIPNGSDDTISRQVAIEALEQIRYALWEIDIPSPTVPEYIEHHRDVQNVMKRIDEIRDKMERLPSVQPQTAKQTDESAQNVPNGDSISRKAAIDAINTWDKFGGRRAGQISQMA